MFDIEAEKERLSEKLAGQFSRNVITVEEYERLLEYLTKVETRREIAILEDLCLETGAEATVYAAPAVRGHGGRHLSLFSWRSSTLLPVDGNGGRYSSVFGANRIVVDNLPAGRTVLAVNAIFGLAEIVVGKGIKVTVDMSPVFSGVFVSSGVNQEEEARSELYITGRALFGNVTVKTAEEMAVETQAEKEFERQYAEKIRKKMLR